MNVHKLKGWVTLVAGLFPGSLAHAQEWPLEQCIDSALVLNRTLEMSKNEQVLQSDRQVSAGERMAVPVGGFERQYKPGVVDAFDLLYRLHEGWF